jgi:hypothetical protein
LFNLIIILAVQISGLLMAVRLTYTTKRAALYLLVLVCFGISETSGQKSLSGNLNQPSAHVKTFTPSSDRITVDDYSGFQAGDTVLLIQMQGVEIDVSNTNSYGFISNFKGQPGLHEFIIIKQLIAPDEIVFEKNIKNAYDPAGMIQVIRVPYYNSAVVTSKLYCNPWNPATGKGGVLALIIGRSLKLNADIDVSDLGFRGAASVTGDGKCNGNDLDIFSSCFSGPTIPHSVASLCPTLDFDGDIDVDQDDFGVFQRCLNGGWPVNAACTLP